MGVRAGFRLYLSSRFKKRDTRIPPLSLTQSVVLKKIRNKLKISVTLPLLSEGRRQKAEGRRQKAEERRKKKEERRKKKEIEERK